jgi:hypothetical protein
MGGVGMTRVETMGGAGMTRVETMGGAGMTRAETMGGAGMTRAETMGGAGMTRAETMGGAGMTHTETMGGAGMTHTETMGGAGVTHTESNYGSTNVSCGDTTTCSGETTAPGGGTVSTYRRPVSKTVKPAQDIVALNCRIDASLSKRTNPLKGDNTTHAYCPVFTRAPRKKSARKKTRADELTPVFSNFKSPAGKDSELSFLGVAIEDVVGQDAGVSIVTCGETEMYCGVEECTNLAIGDAITWENRPCSTFIYGMSPEYQPVNIVKYKSLGNGIGDGHYQRMRKALMPKFTELVQSFEDKYFNSNRVDGELNAIKFLFYTLNPGDLPTSFKSTGTEYEFIQPYFAVYPDLSRKYYALKNTLEDVRFPVTRPPTGDETRSLAHPTPTAGAEYPKYTVENAPPNIVITYTANFAEREGFFGSTGSKEYIVIIRPDDEEVNIYGSPKRYTVKKLTWAGEDAGSDAVSEVNAKQYVDLSRFVKLTDRAAGKETQNSFLYKINRKKIDGTEILTATYDIGMISESVAVSIGDKYAWLDSKPSAYRLTSFETLKGGYSGTFKKSIFGAWDSDATEIISKFGLDPTKFFELEADDSVPGGATTAAFGDVSYHESRHNPPIGIVQAVYPDNARIFVKFGDMGSYKGALFETRDDTKYLTPHKNIQINLLAPPRAGQYLSPNAYSRLAGINCTVDPTITGDKSKRNEKRHWTVLAGEPLFTVKGRRYRNELVPVFSHIADCRNLRGLEFVGISVDSVFGSPGCVNSITVYPIGTLDVFLGGEDVKDIACGTAMCISTEHRGVIIGGDTSRHIARVLPVDTSNLGACMTIGVLKKHPSHNEPNALITLCPDSLVY